MTKGMGHLTEVNLHFLACPDIGDQCLEDIKLFVMKRCKKLQRFKLVISGQILDMGGEGFVYFKSDIGQRLQNNNALSEYAGWDERNQITAKGGASLCRGIARYLKKLQSLTFKMAPVRIENDKKLPRAIWKMISDPSNLQNLNFNSNDYPKVDDEHLAKVTSCIGQNLKKLQSLSLEFAYGNEITERGYQQFAQNFFSCLPPQLTCFALSFESSSLRIDDMIREIGFHIAENLKSLQTLVLRFRHEDELTGRALLELTETISKGLPSLKKLILSFAWCEEINQNFPLVLPEQIQQFDLYSYNPPFSIYETWKNLHRLTLSFEECVEKKSFMDIFSEPNLAMKNLNELKLVYSQSKKIGNKEIRTLASAIGTKLKKLTSLELGFSGCSLLTSDSLLFLGDKICRKLKKLRHLNFSFYRVGDYLNSSFIEGGIRYLASIITSRLENLESLTLFFFCSMDETNMEEMLNELCSAISRNLKKLKRLTLVFTLYGNPQLKCLIREKLCHIPMLYIR